MEYQVTFLFSFKSYCQGALEQAFHPSAAQVEQLSSPQQTVCNCMDVSDGSYLISTYTLRQCSLHNHRYIKTRKQKHSIPSPLNTGRILKMLIVKLLHVKTNTKPKFTAQLSRSQDKLERACGWKNSTRKRRGICKNFN